MLKAILLGISSSTPTKNRNPTGLAIKYESEVILFDVPEMVQQQLMKTKTSYMEINNIFITHFHADHFLGLPGLLATMALHERKQPLTIFGPKGVKEKVLTMLDVFEINLPFELKFKELENKIVLDNSKYYIKAIKVNHRIETYGFIFKEKDKKGKFIKEKAIALGLPEGPLYSQLQNGKTIIYKNKTITPDMVIDYSHIKKGKSIGYFVDLYDTKHKNDIQNLNLLFHETAFLEKDHDQAKKTKHSIAKTVGQLVENEKVKLILINFSTRYKELTPFLDEVKPFHKNTEIGTELKEYILKK